MHEKSELNKLPKVSVVIPSMLRSTLSRSLKSVQTQDYAGSVECIVVLDLAEGACPIPSDVLAYADVILWTGGGARGGGARNLGIARSSGDLVALLDDDDEWMPGKLARQVSLASQFDTGLVVSCRLVHRRYGADSISVPVPRVLICENGAETVEGYLFVRRRPSVDRASLYTSTLLVTGALARAVPWNADLRRHQDWDWLMQLQRAGAVFTSTESADVVVWLNSNGSISSSADWRASLNWIESWKTRVSPAVVADFAAGQPLRYALQARSGAGVMAVLRVIFSSKCMPHIGPIVIGLLGLVPRNLLARLMTRRTERSIDDTCNR